jgi:hypothetical protein
MELARIDKALHEARVVTLTGMLKAPEVAARATCDDSQMTRRS